MVHLAGEGIAEKRWTDEQKRRILESRTKGTSLLVGALASLTDKPPVLVSGSAIGFYGNRGDEQLTEASERGTGFLADVVDGVGGRRRARGRGGHPGAADPHRHRARADGGVLQRLAGLARFGLLGQARLRPASG